MRTIRIVKETERFTWIVPLDTTLTEGDVLGELEFLAEHGFRPLFPLQCSATQGWVCEKMEQPR